MGIPGGLHVGIQHGIDMESVPCYIPLCEQGFTFSWYLLESINCLQWQLAFSNRFIGQWVGDF